MYQLCFALCLYSVSRLLGHATHSLSSQLKKTSSYFQYNVPSLPLPLSLSLSLSPLITGKTISSYVQASVTTLAALAVAFRASWEISVLFLATLPLNIALTVWVKRTAAKSRSTPIYPKTPQGKGVIGGSEGKGTDADSVRDANALLSTALSSLDTIASFSLTDEVRSSVASHGVESFIFEFKPYSFLLHHILRCAALCCAITHCGSAHSTVIYLPLTQMRYLCCLVGSFASAAYSSHHPVSHPHLHPSLFPSLRPILSHPPSTCPLRSVLITSTSTQRSTLLPSGAEQRTDSYGDGAWP
jgi:ABC-type multidrug transport system fused ATPase/permease subunit